ncbi:hypothetical protein SO802_029691 [Lithocarpus litseifolius]|uniref:RNase H type-1 domain-containing protein n=1 Tax=Lithocarpus litseifolius TaxID=425828 RepID=A0AAW2BVY7_9ROSI
MVMAALVNPDQASSSIKKLVESSRSGLMEFKKWEANHVRRHCNIAAHLLARNAYNVDDSIVWVEDTPPLIADQICVSTPSIPLMMSLPLPRLIGFLYPWGFGSRIECDIPRELPD